MSNKFERIILGKLLNKYENSKLSMGGSDRNIKICFKLDEKNLPEYVNEDSYLYEKEINKTVYDLCDMGFIQYEMQRGRIGKVYLNLENVEIVYDYMKIDSPDKRREKYTNIVNEYVDKGELASKFSRMVIDYIKQYKSCLRWFSNYSELREILLILDRLDNQKEEISRRVFSSKYLNDSKRLEVVINKIENIIKECTGLDGEDVLQNYNVYKNPSFVYLKGNGVFKINDEMIDLDKLDAELILSSNHLKKLEIVSLSCGNIVTIENLTSFYEYPNGDELVIYLGGFHNSIRRDLLRKIFDYNGELKFIHCGDIDAGGFYILNHLISDTGIEFVANKMDVDTLIKYKDYTKELTEEDRKRLSDLRKISNMDRYLDVIEYMCNNNVKLEQENIEY